MKLFQKKKSGNNDTKIGIMPIMNTKEINEKPQIQRQNSS